MKGISRGFSRLFRRSRVVAAGALGAAVAGALHLAGADRTALPAPCRELRFRNAGYVVCEIHGSDYDVALRLRDRAGKPFGSVGRAAAGALPVLAMNAGMYHADLSPVGLYVEEGVEVTPLNRDDGKGNFFLKPNGVFFLDTAGKPGVLETEAFAAAPPALRFATQSGPMLVMEGRIHPRFQPDGASRFIRNGVGVRSGTVVLAISREPVSLGAFAALFRDGLGCPDALFFDGAVSALHDGRHYLIGGEHPAGPVLVVTGKAGPGR